MALVNNGTKVSIEQHNLPSGYTKPTVTEFAAEDWRSPVSKTITIDKSTVEAATGSATFTALVAAVTSAVTTLAADYDATNAVTVYADLTNVTTNFSRNGVLYTDGAIQYVCAVDIYVQVA